jgi:predicted CoA-binding protein
MKKVTKAQIDTFLSGKRIAVAGVSRNPKKFGYQVLQSLTDNGYSVLPVNPLADTIYGITCYKSVEDLPGNVDSLLIITPKTETDKVLASAINKGIKNIWVQQASDTLETLRIAEEYQKEIIFGKCIFMFAEPVKSIHKFHRSLVKLFGGLPK